MTFDDYLPINNHLIPDGQMFETYGKVYKVIKEEIEL